MLKFDGYIQEKAQGHKFNEIIKNILPSAHKMDIKRDTGMGHCVHLAPFVRGVLNAFQIT